MSQFRVTQFDSFLIISQIISIQSLLYASLGVIVFIFDAITNRNHSLSHIFEYEEIHIANVTGRLYIFGFILNSFIGSLLLWCLIQRTKLCLDFSCTYHGIHLLICWWYNGSFPTTFSWWLLNAICAAFMCISGEFLCLRSEMKEIPVGYSALNNKVDL